jgi:hypothetical protein
VYLTAAILQQELRVANDEESWSLGAHYDREGLQYEPQ